MDLFKTSPEENRRLFYIKSPFWGGSEKGFRGHSGFHETMGEKLNGESQSWLGHSFLVGIVQEL
jgi:hypothetical protein